MERNRSIVYQHLLRAIRGAGRGCSDNAKESEFQMAVEHSLRRLNYAFISQPQFDEGRPDILIGDYAIELKVLTGGKIANREAVINDQVRKYLSIPGVNHLILAALDSMTHQVFLRLESQRRGLQLVFSKGNRAIVPRKERKEETALILRSSDLTQAFTPDATVPTPLTQEVYEELRLAVARAYPQQARRNLLLLRTLRATGLRISEVLRLERRHVQQEGPAWYLWITRSKKHGALPEKVYITPLLGIELADYSKGLAIGLTDPVFQGAKPGVAMSRRMVETVFEKASLQLSTRVWPHRVRRLYYSWLRDQGLPSRAAAAMIGDTEAVAERHYLEDLPDDRKRAIAERIPE